MKNKIRFYSISYLLTTLLLCGCDVRTTNSAQAKMTLQPATYTELLSVFEQLNYDWETLDEGVPPFALETFPADMASIYDVKLKKQLFFLSLLPMVIMQNEEIMRQRQKLQRLLNSPLPLATQHAQWLQQVCRQYKCPGDPFTDEAIREKLLSRVDVVPTALVLAQAANESAYGTSRFAQQANNIFGQWTFTPGTGLVPENRPDGEYYEVRRFNSLAESIRSYLNNLNTHPAYEALRHSRAQMRRNNAPLEENKLAEGLLNYSTRRDAYVTEIQTMIRYNRLANLSQLKLRASSHLAGKSLLPQHQLSSRMESTRQLL